MKNTDIEQLVKPLAEAVASIGHRKSLLIDIIKELWRQVKELDEIAEIFNKGSNP